ncbi:hypothetical protein ZWY2020_002339 [Hordeum vulgare]|nr:hypothetical protein ZWY2020_002339 [Hordeum vulgare]
MLPGSTLTSQPQAKLDGRPQSPLPTNQSHRSSQPRVTPWAVALAHPTTPGFVSPSPGAHTVRPSLPTGPAPRRGRNHRAQSRPYTSAFITCPIGPAAGLIYSRASRARSVSQSVTPRT